MRNKRQQKHFGPGKKAACIYLSADEHEAWKKRCNELGISVSDYLRRLAAADIERGGSFTIAPIEKKL